MCISAIFCCGDTCYLLFVDLEEIITMIDLERIEFYNCPVCHINFKGRFCFKCKRPGNPVYEKDIPFDRQKSDDSSKDWRT